MTLADMKTALERFGFDETDPLTTWINEGLRQFVDAYPWPFLEALVNVNTVANNDTIVLPSDFFSMITARVTTDSLPLDYMGRIQFENQIQDPTKKAKPTIYTLIGMSTVTLYPIPDAVYPIRLIYRKKVAALVNDADVPAIDSNYHYTAVLGAVAVALQAENEEDRATTALDNFNASIQTAIQAFGAKQSGEFGQVRDSQGYNRC